MRCLTKAVLVLCLVALACGGTNAAIAVYKAAVDPYLPANISYMLNSNAASVTIDIVPHGSTTPVVWTVTKTSPAPEATRGTHTIVWNGTGGTPGVQYDAIVTAVGAAQTAGQVSPLWESPDDKGATRNYYQVAVNSRVPTPENPNPYFGRIYACNYKATTGGIVYKKIEMYEPDGTYIGKMSDTGISWGGSAPWGIAVDADDHVWVTDRSSRRLYRFEPDGSSYKPTPPPGWDFWTDPATTGAMSHFSRGLAVTGSGDTLKVADSHWNTATQFGITYAAGENADGLANPAGRLWIWVSGNNFARLFQPFFAADGKILYGGYIGANGAPTTGGIFSINTDGTNPSLNNGIKRPTCITALGDGSLLVGRWPQSTGDVDATIGFYKYPAGTDLTTANDSTATKLTFAASPATPPTGVTYANFPRFMSADSYGNIVVAGSVSGEAGYSARFGLYAMPDSGSTMVQNAGAVTCSYQPHIISISPASITVNADGTTQVPVDVTVEDLAGYTDIASVTIVANYGAGGTTTFTGTRVSGSGNQAVYRCQVKAQPGDVAGPHTATVNAYSLAGSVPPGTGTMNIRVTDAVLTGKVSATVLSTYYVGGATVVADAGAGDVQTTVSAADGSYSLDLTGGKSYAITVSKIGWATTNGTHISIPHLGTLNRDAQLGPLNVRDTIVVGTERRGDAQPVAVAAVVMRQSAQTGRVGIQDYYVLSDDKWGGTQQGCLVLQKTTDPYFNEGDMVLVEGMWTINSGDKDGYVAPTVTPALISSGNTYPDPVPLYWDNMPVDYVIMSGDKTWGRYVYINGAQVIQPTAPANYSLDPVKWDAFVGRFSTFMINVPTSATDPTLKPVKVEIDTKATVGCYYPQVGDYVDVKGIVCWTDVPWGFYSEATSDVIKVGKPSDVVLHPFPDWSLLRNTKDGMNFSFQNADDPIVVTCKDLENQSWAYVENSARTVGIRALTAPGSELTIGQQLPALKGKLGKDATTGERTLTIQDYTAGITGSNIDPLGLITKNAGGGTTGYTNGITGGFGLVNVGLRVRVAGVVTNVIDPGLGWYATWYVYDGNATPNDLGDPTKGIKVKSPFYYPNLGDKVAVSGVVTLEKSGTTIIPVIYVTEDYTNDVTTF